MAMGLGHFNLTGVRGGGASHKILHFVYLPKNSVHDNTTTTVECCHFLVCGLVCDYGHAPRAKHDG